MPKPVCRGGDKRCSPCSLSETRQLAAPRSSSHRPPAPTVSTTWCGSGGGGGGGGGVTPPAHEREHVEAGAALQAVTRGEKGSGAPPRPATSRCPRACGRPGVLRQPRDSGHNNARTDHPAPCTGGRRTNVQLAHDRGAVVRDRRLACAQGVPVSQSAVLVSRCVVVMVVGAVLVTPSHHHQCRSSCPCRAGQAWSAQCRPQPCCSGHARPC